MSNKIVKGTLLLTSAALLSKILGMIYVIPFNALFGAEGGTLYYFAYNPYTILISLSTVGIPLAVSKIVSRYNTLGDYKTGMRVFRISLLLMTITGLIAFLILYLGADWLANRFIDAEAKDKGIQVADVAKVIKAVSFAVLIVPVMSVVRGFFQGFQSMGPTAVSEVVEQIVRITFVLLSGFLIMIIYKGNYVTAVSFATFAAFIGAIASFTVLIVYWNKRKHHIHHMLDEQRKYFPIPTKDLLMELFSYAGPFIIVGIATPLYQSVDSFTFDRAMNVGGYGEISYTALSAINFYGHKVILIPVTIATGLSLAIIPALTESFTKRNYQKLVQEINQALQIVLLLVIPAVVGLSTLGYETYGALYGMEDLSLTGSLLTWYAPVALFFALFTVTSAILQGINEQRFALVSLTIGFLIKLLLNSLFIHTFSAKGSIFATALAVGTVVGLNLWWIKRSIEFSYVKTIKRTLFMIIFSLFMCGSIIFTKYIFGTFLPYEESRIAATIMLSIGVIVGASIYLLLAYKSTLINYVLGDTTILNRFIRRRKNN